MKMNKNIAASVIAAAVMLSATAVAVPNGIGTGVIAFAAGEIADGGSANVAYSETTAAITVASDCKSFTLNITGLTGLTAVATDPAAEDEIGGITDGFTYSDGKISGTVDMSGTAAGANKTVTVNYSVWDNTASEVTPKTVTVTVTKAAAAVAEKNAIKYSFNDLTGGTASVDKEEAAAGETVTITATPTNTETHVAVVTVTDSEGETVATTKGTGSNANKYTFTMPNSVVTITVEFTEKSNEPTPDDSSDESTPSESTSSEESSESTPSESTSSGDTSTSTPVTSTPTTSTPSTSTPSSSTPSTSDSSTTEAPAVEFKPAEVVVDEAFSEEEAKVVEEIKIEAPEGTFAEGTKLSVKPDTTVTEKNAFALDITFELDGATVQPKDGAAVTVSVPVPPMFKDVAENTLMVFHFDNGKYTKLDATVSNGVVTFKTTHFSTYVISTENLAEKNAPATNPITGVAAMAALPVVALAGAVIIVAKKRK